MDFVADALGDRVDGVVVGVVNCLAGGGLESGVGVVRFGCAGDGLGDGCAGDVVLFEGVLVVGEDAHERSVVPWAEGVAGAVELSVDKLVVEGVGVRADCVENA